MLLQQHLGLRQLSKLNIWKRMDWPWRMRVVLGEHSSKFMVTTDVTDGRW